MPRSADLKPPRFFSRQVVEARRFVLELRPGPNRELTVVSGGWERSAPDYRVSRSGFPHLGLEYVAAGRGRLRLDGHECALSAGVVFVYGPGVPHEIESDPRERLSKYFVTFAGKEAARPLRELGLAPGTFRSVVMGEDVQKAFEDLVRCGQRALPHAPQLAVLYLKALLYTIADAGGAPHAKAQRAFTTYRRCRQFLVEHFAQLATLEDASEACHVDVSYLCRLFSRFAQQSPYAFLQRLKMNHAAALLEGGQLLVREVADSLGMDAFHFSRAFKRVHGLSPSAFASERLRPGERDAMGAASEAAVVNGRPQKAEPSALVPHKHTSRPRSAASAALV